MWDPATGASTHVLAVQCEVTSLVAVGDTLIAGVADGVLAFSVNA